MALLQAGIIGIFNLTEAHELATYEDLLQLLAAEQGGSCATIVSPSKV